MSPGPIYFIHNSLEPYAGIPDKAHKAAVNFSEAVQAHAKIYEDYQHRDPPEVSPEKYKKSLAEFYALRHLFQLEKEDHLTIKINFGIKATLLNRIMQKDAAM